MGSRALGEGGLGMVKWTWQGQVDVIRTSVDRWQQVGRDGQGIGKQVAAGGARRPRDRKTGGSRWGATAKG
eukprot:257911-Chlamydomonas_euryale.AAC.1